MACPRDRTVLALSTTIPTLSTTIPAVGTTITALSTSNTALSTTPCLHSVQLYPPSVPYHARTQYSTRPQYRRRQTACSLVHSSIQ
eukprot:715772-Rhodomonas_salina.1